LATVFGVLGAFGGSYRAYDGSIVMIIGLSPAAIPAFFRL